jgi:hypothetical protein
VNVRFDESRGESQIRRIQTLGIGRGRNVGNKTNGFYNVSANQDAAGRELLHGSQYPAGVDYNRRHGHVRDEAWIAHFEIRISKCGLI